MRFSVNSSPPAAARAFMSALLLLLSCATMDVETREIGDRTIVSSDESTAPTIFVAVSNSSTVEKLQDAPVVVEDALAEVYHVTDSPVNNADVPEPEVAAANDFVEFDITSDEITEATDRWWIQKIPRKQPSNKSPKNLRAPESGPYTFKSSGNPLSLGQVIANVLYGPAWPAIHTSSECSEDMRTYNTHMQNFTLWAAKSKLWSFSTRFVDLFQ